MTSLLMNESAKQRWDNFLLDHQEHHLLQIPEWALLKSKFGWKAEFISESAVGAQVLFRKLPLGFSIAYIPKGPLGPVPLWGNLWNQLDSVCKKNHAIFLKIEPDAWESQASEIRQAFNGYALSSSPIQPHRTLLIDLTGTSDEWLARMKQKTRYNIHLAEKKDITIEESDDVETFQKLMLATGARNEFGVHDFEYYRAAYQLMAPEHCAILQASFQGKPLAAIMVFFAGNRAWYFYGASSDIERNRMPTYLLQFEAMKLAAARGCTVYDLWGIPDFPESQLEEQFSERSDGLWGVYRFKRGFGGNVVRSAGAFDRIYKPILYKIYRHFYQGASS